MTTRSDGIAVRRNFEFHRVFRWTFFVSMYPESTGRTAGFHRACRWTFRCGSRLPYISRQFVLFQQSGCWTFLYGRVPCGIGVVGVPTVRLLDVPLWRRPPVSLAPFGDFRRFPRTPPNEAIRIVPQSRRFVNPFDSNAFNPANLRRFSRRLVSRKVEQCTFEGPAEFRPSRRLPESRRALPT